MKLFARALPHPPLRGTFSHKWEKGIMTLQGYILGFLLCIFFCVGNADQAAPILPAGSTRATLASQVQLEQQELTHATRQWKREQVWMQARFHAAHQGVTEEELMRLALSRSVAEAALESTRFALQQVNAAIQTSQQRLSTLQQNWQDQVLVSTHAEYATHLVTEREREQHLLQLQQKRLALLRQLLTLQERQVAQWITWQNQLAWLQVEQQRAYDSIQLSNRLETLQQEQQHILHALDRITTQTTFEQASVATREMILVWRERLTLSQLTLLVAELKVRIQPYGYGPSLAQGELMSDIEFRLGQFSAVLRDLMQARDQTQVRMVFLEQHAHLFAMLPDGATFRAQLMQGYTAELRVITDFMAHIQQLQTENRAVLQKNLSIRQVLPGLDVWAWLALFGQIVSLPWLVLKAAQAVFIQVRHVFMHFTLWEWGIWSTGACVFMGIWYGLRRYFRHVQAVLLHKERRFSHNLLWIVVRLLDRNWNGALLAALLITLQTVFGFDIHIFWVLILIDSNLWL